MLPPFPRFHPHCRFTYPSLYPGSAVQLLHSRLTTFHSASSAPLSSETVFQREGVKFCRHTLARPGSMIVPAGPGQADRHTVNHTVCCVTMVCVSFAHAVHYCRDVYGFATFFPFYAVVAISVSFACALAFFFLSFSFVAFAAPAGHAFSLPDVWWVASWAGMTRAWQHGTVQL